jgi:hypothetical protein
LDQGCQITKAKIRFQITKIKLKKIPPPPNYIQSMNQSQQSTANQMSGNACNRISQLPMGIGQPNSIKIPLDPDYNSDYDSGNGLKNP